MITLPQGLNEFMKGQNLDGLKPFALLYRNKWDSVNNKYALDTTPIDISALIAKPNTLSMTLDVNEVAQYNANNVTLTLSDTKNYFVEGTPNSYFPEGYQIYGSRIVLYYGTDGVNRTPLFTGVIKELPTHKPENYQVDVKLVSPLEMLKDIEAKEFSDKVTGETLTYKSTDSDGHRIYWTTGTGVGGFDAVYANGTKLFEGVDYEIDKLNALSIPAIVTIINSAYYSATITADYYTWKTGLTVEQIISGLVGLAGYDSGTEDIRSVVWNTSIRTQEIPTNLFTLGYTKNGGLYTYSGEGSYSYGANLPKMGFLYLFGIDWSDNRIVKGTNVFPSNFSYELKFPVTGQTVLRVGGTTKYFAFTCGQAQTINCAYVNGDPLQADSFEIFTDTNNVIKMEKNGNTYTFSGFSPLMPGVQKTITADIDWDVQDNIMMANCNYSYAYPVLLSQKLTDLDSGVFLENYGIALSSSHQDITTWVDVDALKSDDSASTTVRYRTTDDGTDYSEWSHVDIGADLGVSSKTIQFTIELNDNSLSTNFTNTSIFYLGQELTISLVNLSGKTVLESLQDFALISGYEFGVDRQGVFFFRPRVSSTTPTYILDHTEIVKVDTVKKNLSDFFTKLTLTFAQVPLEFYANTGERPTLVDKYGIINKEIDKPDIVNYDNPELAQAIGPQLLEVYSALPNIIQVTGKLNLAIELGDIVSLRRNMNLITPEGYTDYSKYTDLNTYYRACKITGMNYNFSKRQITYTLRDVSNKNTEPQYEFNEYVYDYPIEFGVKE